MPGYLVTGVRGAGKSLVAVGRMLDHLRAGLPVATNIDLRLEGVKGIKGTLYRMPDMPQAADFDALGTVHDSGDESRDGLLVLDECATWLNSRDWNGRDRLGIIEWLVQSRKRGWSLLFLVQSADMIDKQARTTLFDYRVACRRLDRLKIPGVGALGRALTFGLWSGRFPRVHFGVVMYGSGPGAAYVETWKYRGSDLFDRYRTGQIMSRVSEDGVHAVWQAPPAPVARGPLGAVLKPKLPEVAALMQLPDAQRIRAVQARPVGAQ